MTKPHTICTIPWQHLAIQQNGDYRICCQIIDKPYGKLSQDDKFLNAQSSTFESIRNHPTLAELRKSMINGEKHSLCNLCWKDEANGLNSKRIFMSGINDPDYIEKIEKLTKDNGTIDVTDFPITYLDLRFGNLCNLKCRSCGPNDSSLWYEDYYNMSGGTNESIPLWFYGSTDYKIGRSGKTFDIIGPHSDDFKWYEKESFWTEFELNIQNVDRLYLTGGEPLVNKAHFKLLQMCVDHGVAEKISLEYNTNMHAVPELIYELWSHFKSIDVGCSIDGINDMANYLRPPSTWVGLEKNIRSFAMLKHQSLHVKLSTTISVFNILNFLELSDWLVKNETNNLQGMPSFHVLHNPDYMSVQVLPIETKQWIVAQYENFFVEAETKYSKDWAEAFRRCYAGILSFMMGTDKTHLLPVLKEKTIMLDKLRNQDLSLIAPWLYKILKEDL